MRKKKRAAGLSFLPRRRRQRACSRVAPFLTLICTVLTPFCTDLYGIFPARVCRNGCCFLQKRNTRCIFPPFARTLPCNFCALYRPQYHLCGKRFFRGARPRQGAANIAAPSGKTANPPADSDKKSSSAKATLSQRTFHVKQFSFFLLPGCNFPRLCI